MPRARVLHHGKCFDGAVSAALMIRLLRAVEPKELEFETGGMMHKEGSPWDDGSFSGEINAVVDFRYSSDPRLDWWFDHHATAFLSDDERRHFEADRRAGRERRKFFDPAASSCAGLIARVGGETFGLDLAARDPGLIEWAERIDAADFDSPEMAVGLEPPALQIMTWLEGPADEAGQARLVTELAEGRTLDALAASPWIRETLDPALATHREHVALVAERIGITGGVAFVDLGDRVIEGINKFIPHAHDPSLSYTVVVLQMPRRTKVAVGSNPWAPERRRHDIGAICQRFGGGGHAVVGAVSLGVHEIERAREVARAIAAELRA